MNTKRISLTVAALAILSAAPVLADQGAEAAARPNPEPDKAEQLRAQAEALFSQPKQWKKAVRLLEQSAALREADDAEAYDCLIYAGRIRASIGDLQGARLNLEQAAAHALARGEIVDAANAFIDAAHAAVALKDADGARELVERASLLTQSPLLSLHQRTQLQSRIDA